MFFFSHFVVVQLQIILTKLKKEDLIKKINGVSCVSALSSDTIHRKITAYSRPVCSVYETSEYDRFEFIPENRPVDDSHVEALVASMQVAYLPSVVVCRWNPETEKLEVYDGQHRIDACEALKIPVRYIVVPDLSIDHLKLYNIENESWQAESYLHHFCERSFPEYLKLREFRDNYLTAPTGKKVGISDAIHIAIGVTPGGAFYAKDKEGLVDLFKMGTLVIPQAALDRGKEYAKVLITMSEAFPKHWFRRNFIHAFYQFYKKRGYDNELMIRKAKKHGKKFYVAQSTVLGYGQALQEIYNYFQHGKREDGEDVGEAKKKNRFYIDWVKFKETGEG